MAHCYNNMSRAMRSIEGALEGLVCWNIEFGQLRVHYFLCNKQGGFGLLVGDVPPPWTTLPE